MEGGGPWRREVRCSTIDDRSEREEDDGGPAGSRVRVDDLRCLDVEGRWWSASARARTLSTTLM
jgi:hypothetical protein